MKSFSGSKKTNPNKANPSTLLRTGFKRGGYAALRSAYKKTLFFSLNLVEWTLGQLRKLEYRISKFETNSKFKYQMFKTLFPPLGDFEFCILVICICFGFGASSFEFITQF